MIDDYVIYYLEELRKVCDFLFFISSSPLPESEVSKINGICDKIITRENAGLDFMSYKAGVSALSAHDYDELILCNDSVYGPLFPLDKIFSKMQTINCDFWGVTESCDIAYHIQSYFVVFRKNVLESEVFREFWKNVTVLERQAIIKKYEVGLSQLLLINGFTAKAYVHYRPTILDMLRSRTAGQWFQWLQEEFLNILSRLKNPKNFTKTSVLNPTHFFWRQLIASQRMPFVKVVLLRDNPMNLNVKEYDMLIRSLSDYDSSLIKRHLERMRY